MLFSYGFRPFFLGAALWAVLAMILWLGMLSGRVVLPVVFDPVSWHAQAFVFGYLTAVIAGFLLTAVPSWTGRAPLAGRPLAGLFVLWLIGRGASLISALMPPLVFVVLDNAMPVVLAAVILREIIAGRNWKNLVVLLLLILLVVGNLLFHAGAGGVPSAGAGLRLEVMAGVLMIALIGGRVVPAFTRNWLQKAGQSALPAPMGRYDLISLVVLFSVLVFWLAQPEATAVQVLLLLVGVLHFIRLWRWNGWLAWREPLVAILHIGYLCIPLGAALIGVSGLLENGSSLAAAQHVWMAGAIGIMTLAIMTRATLGHTGHALTAGPGTVAICVAVVGAVVARLLAAVFGAVSAELLMASGLLWIAAFGGFALFYGPLLLRERKTS